MIYMMCAWTIIALLAGAAAGADTRQVEHAYDFGFEDPFVPWVSNTTWTEHFRGITKDKTFKLDVTFKKSGYAYWVIPVSVPAAGELKLAGRIRVDVAGETTARLGINVTLPPTVDTGCKPFETFGRGGQWHDIDGDVVAMGRTIANIVVSPNTWGLTGEQASARVDRVVLFVYPSKGDHMVIEVDDVRLIGRVPTDEAFDAIVEQQAGAYRRRVDEQHAAWLARLDKLHAAFASRGPAAERFAEKADELQRQLDAIAERRKIDRDQHAAMESWLAALEPIAEAIEDLDLQSTLWFVVDPTGTTPIRPSDGLVPGAVSQTISIAAAANEYESASFVIAPTEDMRDVNVTATMPDGVLDVDVRIVKCWYQSGSAWNGIGQDRSRRVLVPELLLYDDALVRVDHDTQRNALRVGKRYIDISDPDEPSGGGMKILDVAEYNVRDATTLQPVDIAAKTNRQFWLTVQVPADTAPGRYEGAIEVTAGDKELGTMRLLVRVHPFALADPRTRHDLVRPFVSSVFYRSQLSADHPDGTISSEQRSEAQLLAELRNMVAHNITNPTCYQPEKDRTLLARYLALRADAGINSDTLYSTNAVRPSSDPATLERIRSLLAWLGERRIKTTYLFGIDEARGDMLQSQRDAWIATRKTGAKVAVAGYRDSNFPTLGDIQDVLICAGDPSPEEAALWHSVGHQIWCYANPQTGPENPGLMRRNFGLALWLANYDGACTYAYMHSFGNIWNDFDDDIYRDHCFVYPTVDGVIDTLAIEGYREGIDDIRYVTTLALAVRDAKDGPAKAEAQAFLDGLTADGDLDATRAAIIERILRLQ